MEITYLGHSSFKLKGKKTSVITDPFLPTSVGLKFPKAESDIITISHGHEDHNATDQVTGSPFIIDGPGEYEVKGVSIIGVSSYHDASQGKERGKNTIYTIEIDGIHIAHLGDVGTMLTDKEIEQIGNVNILLIPVGGVYTITAKQASELVPEIDPNIVIPMHFGRPELNQDVYAGLEGVDSFLKLLGGTDGTVKQPKLVITKDKLPEQLQVIVLES